MGHRLAPTASQRQWWIFPLQSWQPPHDACPGLDAQLYASAPRRNKALDVSRSYERHLQGKSVPACRRYLFPPITIPLMPPGRTPGKRPRRGDSPHANSPVPRPGRSGPTVSRGRKRAAEDAVGQRASPGKGARAWEGVLACLAGALGTHPKTPRPPSSVPRLGQDADMGQDRGVCGTNNGGSHSLPFWPGLPCATRQKEEGEAPAAGESPELEYAAWAMACLTDLDMESLVLLGIGGAAARRRQRSCPSHDRRTHETWETTQREMRIRQRQLRIVSSVLCRQMRNESGRAALSRLGTRRGERGSCAIGPLLLGRPTCKLRQGNCRQ